MSAETTTVSVDEIDAALAAATPDLGEDEQRLATAVLRLLSAGEPTAVPAAAALAGMPMWRARPGGPSPPRGGWMLARGVVGRPRQGDRILGPGSSRHAAPHPPRGNRSARLVRV